MNRRSEYGSAWEDTRSRWESAFCEALEYDTWGQVEEALESYRCLEAAVTEEFSINSLNLSCSRRRGIGKFACGLRTRMTQLAQDNGVEQGLEDMRALRSFVKNFGVDVPTSACHGRPSVSEDGSVGFLHASLSTDQSTTTSGSEVGTSGELLCQPKKPPDKGAVTLSILVVQWGFKDPTQFCKPRVVVSVVDRKGKALEPVQETPPSIATEGLHLKFGNSVDIQTPLKKLGPASAIFFELRHWKEKKKKKSVKAYCFLELDEIKPGEVVLEAYKKPTDFRRRKQPRLLSVKPLFLRLKLTLKTH